MFAPEVFEERRNRLQTRLQTGLVLLLGSGESPLERPGRGEGFRQDRTFLYLTGVDEPGFALLMDLDQGVTTLFGDEPPPEAQIWTGALPSLAELAWRAGITSAAPSTKLKSRLQKAQGRTIRFLPPARAESRLKLLQLLGLLPEHQMAAVSTELVHVVAELQACKSPEEIAEIERATDLSVDMHLAAMRMARPGMAEWEIAARVAEIALASGYALSRSVVATTHGEIIRNPRHDVVLENGRMFLLTAGAETPQHYVGDITSSFPVNRTFSARQKEIYQIAWNALQAATAALKPGVPFQEVHRLACRTMVEGLKALGLMKGDANEAVAAGAHALFFPHSLGHLPGLDFHDMDEPGETWTGLEGSARFDPAPHHLTGEMKPGVVFALEPGLYFMPGLIDRWQAEHRLAAFIDYPRLEPYRSFGGIRLGDNLVMLEHGARRLGKPIPRIPSEIEVVRGGS